MLISVLGGEFSDFKENLDFSVEISSFMKKIKIQIFSGKKKKIFGKF